MRTETGTTIEEEPTQRIVRTYSLQVPTRISPANDAFPLAQFLQEMTAQDAQVEASQWRRFFEPIPADQSEPGCLTRVLEVESRRLCEKHNELSLLLPDSPAPFNPTIGNLINTIETFKGSEEDARENTSMGRARTRFHNFCRALDSHASLIRILPEGNQYVGIFTGILNAIIQASSRQQKSAEKLAQALCDISKDIGDCEIAARMYPTQDITQRVAELYADVFLFFSDYMDHLKRKIATRIRKSFNEDFDRGMQEHVTEIKCKIQRIRYQAEISSHAELRAVRLDTEKQGRVQRVGLEGLERANADILAETRAIKESRRNDEVLFEELIQMLYTIREQNAGIWDAVQLSNGSSALSGHRAIPPGPAASFDLVDKLDVLVKSRHFEDYFCRNSINLFGDEAEARPARCPPAVLSRMIRWLQGSSSSRLLWFDGPPSRGFAIDNPVTLLAGAMVDIASGLKLPLMAYFSEPRRNETLRNGNTREMQELIGVLLAVIRQAMELLMPQFETSHDFSEKRLSKIDGTARTWDETLALFRGLIPSMPDKVLCIIDGLECTDTPNTSSHLAELLDALRDSGFKVLLTTSGRTPTLKRNMLREETLPPSEFDVRRAQVLLSPRNVNLGA